MRSKVEQARADETDDAGALLKRALRCRRRGELRKYKLTLRKACQRHETSARLWTQYAFACALSGDAEEARAALLQALWLRQRCREQRRVETTRELLARLSSGAFGVPRRAA